MVKTIGWVMSPRWGLYWLVIIAFDFFSGQQSLFFLFSLQSWRKPRAEQNEFIRSFSRGAAQLRKIHFAKLIIFS